MRVARIVSRRVRPVVTTRAGACVIIIIIIIIMSNRVEKDKS